VSPFHTCCRKKFLYSKHITGASNIETKLIFSPKTAFCAALAFTDRCFGFAKIHRCAFRTS